MEPIRRAIALALCTAAAGCGSCEPDRASPKRDGTAPALAASGAGEVPSRAPARRTTVPCRAVAADGEVRLQTEDGGVVLAPQDELEPGHWVWLSPDARLVAKDPRTSRETTFRGLGHVQPCVGQAEESWITSGRFESTAGAGEMAGAEEWVVTPLGVVRFGAGKVIIDAPAGTSSVEIEVASAIAFVWPAQDASVRGPDGGAVPAASDEGWLRVSGTSATLGRAAQRPPPEASRAAIEACRAAGRSAHELAGALVGADASGKTAAAQVTARRVARAACAVAAIRVDSLFEGAGKEALSESLKEADALWRALPGP